MSNLTDKDKKDWKNFVNSENNIKDKDYYEIKNKKNDFFKSIDLHGYSLDEANKKIKVFIENCYEDGVKEINIITGKGTRSKNIEDPFKSSRFAILKYSVPDFIKNNLDLMKKISKIDFESINNPSIGSFSISLINKK